MIQEVKPKFETVMVVDDTEMDRYITGRIINKNHFGKTLIQCESAEDALKYLKDNEKNMDILPQVIFLDIYMPIMSGFQFMEKYDEFPSELKNHCRIYIISSTSDTRDIARAKNDKNVAAFQEKPITKEFLEKIKE